MCASRPRPHLPMPDFTPAMSRRLRRRHHAHVHAPRPADDRVDAGARPDPATGAAADVHTAVYLQRQTHRYMSSGRGTATASRRRAWHDARPIGPAAPRQHVTDSGRMRR
ncbi:hypothetical protein CDD83_8843 [Cordyceps sp. RAO-2017]|nr:hypothetical protein CDD83_8843 [Cordyceps sp. RAO-2017]